MSRSVSFLTAKSIRRIPFFDVHFYRLIKARFRNTMNRIPIERILFQKCEKKKQTTEQKILLLTYSKVWYMNKFIPNIIFITIFGVYSTKLNIVTSITTTTCGFIISYRSHQTMFLTASGNIKRVVACRFITCENIRRSSGKTNDRYVSLYSLLLIFIFSLRKCEFRKSHTS